MIVYIISFEYVRGFIGVADFMLEMNDRFAFLAESGRRIQIIDGRQPAGNDTQQQWKDECQHHLWTSSYPPLLLHVFYPLPFPLFGSGPIRRFSTPQAPEM